MPAPPDVCVCCYVCGGLLKVNPEGTEISHVTEVGTPHRPAPMAITRRGVAVVEAHS